MTVLLLDVDNTLLDNDRMESDLRAHMDKVFGRECRLRYWSIFEEHRAALGYADYLGALQQYRIEHPEHPGILEMSFYLLDYPFSDRLYPGAMELVGRLGDQGTCVILSDGDAVFQPNKIRRSGLWQAVGGRVLVYVHKEEMLDDVRRKYPSGHYVMIDDKLRILAAMKAAWRDSLTAVWVAQGHYAADPGQLKHHGAADLRADHIGDLTGVDLVSGVARERD